MLRTLVNAARQASAARSAAPSLASAARRPLSVSARAQSEALGPDFDAKWKAYFESEENDALMLRRGLNDIFAHDAVPDKAVLEAALRATRRVNDFPTSVRIFEGIKDKGGDEAYTFMVKELQPVIDELGLSTPEHLGLQ